MMFECAEPHIMFLHSNTDHMLEVTDWERLSKTQCYVSPDWFFRCYWCRSYGTVIAYYDIDAGILYSFGKYSKTSSSHLTKFRNWLWFSHGPAYEKYVYATDIPVLDLELVNWPKLAREGRKQCMQ